MSWQAEPQQCKRNQVWHLLIVCQKAEIVLVWLLSDHAADMVICSSEGFDESGGVDSLVLEIPRVQCAGSPHGGNKIPLAGFIYIVFVWVKHLQNLSSSCNKQTRVFIMMLNKWQMCMRRKSPRCVIFIFFSSTIFTVIDFHPFMTRAPGYDYISPLNNLGSWCISNRACIKLDFYSHDMKIDLFIWTTCNHQWREPVAAFVFHLLTVQY